MREYWGKYWCLINSDSGETSIFCFRVYQKKSPGKFSFKPHLMVLTSPSNLRTEHLNREHHNRTWQNTELQLNVGIVFPPSSINLYPRSSNTNTIQYKSPHLLIPFIPQIFTDNDNDLQRPSCNFFAHVCSERDIVLSKPCHKDASAANTSIAAPSRPGSRTRSSRLRNLEGTWRHGLCVYWWHAWLWHEITAFCSRRKVLVATIWWNLVVRDLCQVHQPNKLNGVVQNLENEYP